MLISRYKKLFLIPHILQKNHNLCNVLKMRYCIKIQDFEEVKYKKRRHIINEQSAIIKTKYEEKEIPTDSNDLTKNTQNREVEFNNNQEYSFLSSHKLITYEKKKTAPLSHEDNDIIYINSDDQNKLSKDTIIKTNKNMFLANHILNLNEFTDQQDNTTPQPLDKCNENISDFGPGLAPTLNFAAYANKSKLIQTLIKIGVKLYKLEKNSDHMKALLTIDLKNELPLYLHFFHDCGVPANVLGDIITINPILLKEDLDHMKTRIRYLKAHNFTEENITRIITKNPSWLTWKIKSIDERLGHFQNEFKLSGSQVRYLATKQPKLITHSMKVIHENTFAVREEMGFNPQETRILLLNKPSIWKMSRHKIVESFIYLQDVMKLSSSTIITNANLLTTRTKRLKNRHEYLLHLGKVQYNPKNAEYISPMDVAFGSDVKFCEEIAKTSVGTYYMFLKTL